MESECKREVIELHQFFQDWFNGEIAESDDIFARCSDVLSTGFTIVSPDGRMTDRENLLPALRHAYGSRRGENGSFRIWTENLQVRQLAEDLALVTYEEWQSKEEHTTARLSSAVFQRKEGLPHNAAWLHVHETWLEI